MIDCWFDSDSLGKDFISKQEGSTIFRTRIGYYIVQIKEKILLPSASVCVFFVLVLLCHQHCLRSDCCSGPTTFVLGRQSIPSVVAGG